MILFLFFCSGATALIYEVVWSKYLALMFGSTIHAQTVVLAVFMGGLALGNWWIGGRADLLRRPLKAYGYIELLIGLYAFAFPILYANADKVFVRCGAGLLDHGLLLLGFKGLLSMALLLAPTILMGGTLPLLAAWLQKESAEAGRRSARFYSVNSLGAVAGAGLAGFTLVRQLGMVSTLQMTGLANVMVGAAAIWLSQRARPAEEIQQPSLSGAAVPPENMPSASFAWACALVAVTGGVSLGLEVLASRSLAMIFGASLQSFAVMLMAFILGIGAGSAVISSPRFNRAAVPTLTTSLLLCAAFSVAAFLVSIEEWAIFYAKARTGLASTNAGYFFHEILTSMIAIAVLGLPAGLLGSILPLWIRILSGSTTTLGKGVGRLLTWNTLGAVIGVLLTGFILMPNLGVHGALGAFAVVISLFAGVTAWLHQQPRAACFSVALAGVVIWISFSQGGEWKHVLASGIFRLRTAEVPWNLLEQRRKFVDLVFYKDGPDATVSVETGSKLNGGKDRVLRVNGKPDASTQGDLSTQYLLAHLPLLARPQSQDVFVLGFGSGITAGALLNHPIERVVIAENCRPVLEAGSIFEPWNRGVLTNSRARVHLEDGRTVLKLSAQQYDVIISEPSNPWVAGVASVFTQEFYEIASSRLKEGGIMAQWFHMYEMHDGIAFLVLRTFAKVFEHIEIWDSQEGDMILLGSHRPWPSSSEAFREAFFRGGVREDLERIGIKSPETLFARQAASQRTAFAIAGDGPIQSDAFPVLEYAAPKAFYIGAFAQQIFLFDERTWQMALAPAEKRLLLSSMPDEVLFPTFATYTFSNRELLQYLQWRRSSLRNNEGHEVYPASPFLPVVFRPEDSFPLIPEIPPNSTSEAEDLLVAQALIFARPTLWEGAVLSIEKILEARATEKDKPPIRDWLPGHFAATAARARLSHGDAEGARRAVELGLKIEPNDIQLLYLQRIINRWHSK
ncbi:MAG: fused MFS/spermidine synthase [Verrucomicrobia bacterium]|nr:fused MFS/spermidine synthase [Verrucomicrobiota bacterium]